MKKRMLMPRAISFSFFLASDILFLFFFFLFLILTVLFCTIVMIRFFCCLRFFNCWHVTFFHDLLGLRKEIWGKRRLCTTKNQIFGCLFYFPCPIKSAFPYSAMSFGFIYLLLLLSIFMLCVLILVL